MNSGIVESDVSDTSYLLGSSKDMRKKNDQCPRSVLDRLLVLFLSLFPVWGWLPKYKFSYIRGDVVAGITVGITLIPQGMAYALVAGMPPIYGLYASVVPPLMYVIMGTSPHLSIGPFAVISLLTREAVINEMHKVNYDPDDEEKYVSIAITLCFLVGIATTVCGILRLGFVSNFLSDPVRNGFNSASAITIILSQLPSMFGLKLPAKSFQLAVVAQVIEHIKETNKFSVIICVSGIFLLLALKKIGQQFKKFTIPGPLIVLIIATLLSYFFDLRDRVKLPVVGPVPSGLPRVTMPKLVDAKLVVDLLPGAAVIVIVSYMSSIAIASKFAENFGYTIRANQELIAFGAAQVVGSFFSCFPVSASLSRTAINTSSGAKTQVAGLVTAVLISVTLLLLTSAVRPLPKAALASVVLVAVCPLVEVKAIPTLWREKKRDLLVMVLTFASTLLIGILTGLLVGMSLSLLVLAYNNSYPAIEILQKIPNTTTYKPVHIPKTANDYPPPSVLAASISATSLNFTNMASVKLKLDELVETYEAIDPVRVILLDCTNIYDVDSTALRSLRDLIRHFHKSNVAVCFANVSAAARATLVDGKIICDSLLREECVYNNLHDAVEDCYQKYVVEAKPASLNNNSIRKVAVVNIN